MAGFGFGFGAVSSPRRPLVPFTAPAFPTVSASESWTGIATSGFSMVPVDPLRTTAKPALRMVVAPNQSFTDDLLVGFVGGANENGTLMNELGIEKVVLNFEGGELEIAAPSWQTPPSAPASAGGSAVAPKPIYGWWAKLKNDGRSGVGQLYATAVPRDPAMQSRVIGPFTFLPQAVLHEKAVEIAASKSEIAGQRYKTVKNACNGLRTGGYTSIHMQITEAGAYDLEQSNSIFCPGFVTISASVPGVVFKRPAALVENGNGADARFRPRIGHCRITGANITMDFAHAKEFYGELNNPYTYWIDGISIINSRGRAALLWKDHMMLTWLFRRDAWMTECAVSGVPQGGRGTSLVRGCTFKEVWNDTFSAGGCIINSVVEDLHSDDYNEQRDAFTVTGPVGATLSLSNKGGSDALRTFTAKEGGVSVGTFQTTTDLASYHANTNYHVHNVVDWLNTLPGWTAVLHDDTRLANAVSDPTGPGSSEVGPFDNVDVSAGKIFVTEFDLHTDFFQGGGNAQNLWENQVIWGNVGFNMNAQSLFLGDATYQDFLIVNNAWANREPVSYVSQLDRYPCSHVMIAHNTWSTQDFRIRIAMDEYSLVANNAVYNLYFFGGSAAEGVIFGNHLSEGATGTGEAGETIGGTAADLFADQTNGDFTPAGSLLSNLKTPVVKYDLVGNERGATAPSGASI